MSDEQYPTMLRYHNGVGLAKLHGSALHIVLAPDLGNGPVHRLEYRPTEGRAGVSYDKHESLRQMFVAEIHMADTYLRNLFAGAGLTP